jgi:hypothetical protein
MAQECEENLKMAKLNSIKQIRLVRLLKMNYLGNQTTTFKNSNENVICEAVTDTNDSSYLVTLDQIYDIVGEGDWIHGENNCLVNLAYGQMIMLCCGAKRKECKEQRRVLSDEGLQVGDHVFVVNHGNQSPHKAQIVDIDMENNFASIKWETTQNIAYIDLEDSKHFSMDDSAPRKQKYTDFYTPPSGKKMHRLSNVKITDLICNVAQKICFIQRRTLLMCALKVLLGT